MIQQSLALKKGRYYAILSWIDEDGKRRQRWFKTGLREEDGKKKARQKLTEIVEEVTKSGELFESRRPVSNPTTFRSLCDSWMAAAGQSLDPITLQGFEVLMSCHIRPFFKDDSITDITSEKLVEFFTYLLESGRKDGAGGLSRDSVKKVKSVIHHVIKHAIELGDLSEDPCLLATIPPKKEEKRPAKTYTPEQMRALFEAIKDDPLFPVVYFTATYGLRRSEALGLKWDAVDMDGGLFVIRHVVAKVSTIVEKDSTKTKSSRRTYPLTDTAKSILNGLRTGENGSGYVFTHPDGSPFSPDYVSAHFRRLLKSNNLPVIRFHDLRHSCASIMLSRGYLLKDVQAWLGHADIQTTANIYGHLEIGRKIEIGKAMERLVERKEVLTDADSVTMEN